MTGGFWVKNTPGNYPGDNLVTIDMAPSDSYLVPEVHCSNIDYG